MAKLTLPDIGTLSNQSSAREAMNENFDLIEEAMDNTLSRDGTTPNQMEADIDLNGNSLINVADPVADGDAVNKRYVGELVDDFVSQIAEVLIEGTARSELHIATAGQTEFVLTDVAGTVNNTYVFVNGLALIPTTDFTLTTEGTVVELLSGASLNDEVLIRYTELAPSDSLLRTDLASTTETKGGFLVRFIAAGVGAVSRWITERMRETYHLSDYADDPAALAAGTESMLIAWDRFQAAAPAEGCTVRLPAGVLSLPSTWVIGNQAAGTLPSTLNGIKIKGQGTGRTATTMNANAGATRIRWDGAAGGTMALIGGPISGISLEDVVLDANASAATLIESRRSFHQTVRRVLGVNWTGVGIKVHATSALVGYGGAAPIGQVWDQVELQNPSGASACGIDIGQGNGNLNQLNFRRCYLDRSNNINTWSARFGYCDHLVFEATHFAQTGALGSTGKAIVVQPQTGVTNFPQNIMLLGCSFAGGVHHDTSVGGAWTQGPTPAIIAEPWATADGAPVPPNAADGGAALPGWLVRGHTDNGLEIGWSGEVQQAVAATPTIAPTHNVIILDDDAGTAANNLIANITPPRSVFSVPLGGYRLTIIPAISGTHPVKLVTGGNIAQDVTLQNYQAVELVYSEGTGFWSVIDAGSSGVYTPTVTNIANTSALTAREFHWSRSGDTIEFTGRIEFTATAGADTASQIEFSLPVAPAAFGASWELGGTGVVTETVYRPAALIASGSAGRVLWQSAAASAKAVIIKGSYQAK